MGHLTVGQKYEIEHLLKDNYNHAQIARRIGRHKSTVAREIRRNADRRGGHYRAELAQGKTKVRHDSKNKKSCYTPEVRARVEQQLQLDYSPEQIVGRSRLERRDCVNHETFYKYIWKDKKAGGRLYLHLRRQGRAYNRRGAARAGRGMIKNRVSIEKRDPVVDARTRFGDLEVDTIVGRNHKGAIVTINDRASGMLKIKRTRTREAAEVTAAINELLGEWLPYIRTMTADNGKEFAHHEMVSEQAGIDFYFADAYSSWQRGANETLNWLVRQYFPKKTDFDMITDEQVQEVEDILNNKPGKRHDFETPLEIMEKLLFKNEVAFMT
ncbi:MAG: IS30 family transposase [Nonlabens sp.]